MVRRFWIVGAFGALYLALFMASWLLQGSIPTGGKPGQEDGNVMAAQYPGRCSEILKRHLGTAEHRRVTISANEYLIMVKEMQSCAQHVKATAAPQHG